MPMPPVEPESRSSEFPAPQRDAYDAEFTEVYGWASDNYAQDHTPAVIINAQAEALTLLSWGIGQLQQCNALLEALGSGERVKEYGSQAPAAILHFSKQAEILLRAGIRRIANLRC